METAELIVMAKKLMQLPTDREYFRHMTCAKEFLRVYAGESSRFYRDLQAVDSLANFNHWPAYANGALGAFVVHAENSMLKGMPLERAAQIDVVSDFLSQAIDLLQDKQSHPAAPAMLIGAALEEFLRNWVDAEKLALREKKPCISAYCDLLKANGFIGKQDAKDITAWAGLRNHAAHGEWDQVSDRSQIDLMLQGVNLFMRRYGPAG